MDNIRISQLLRMSHKPLLEIGEETALAAPRITAERELTKVRINTESPKREGEEPVAVQPENLKRAQMDEGGIGDEAKLVVLQV